MKSIRLLLSAALALTLGNQLQAQQWGNYTLYATMNGTSAYLIDTNNTTYHSWTFTNSYKTGYSSYLLPGGTLLRTVARQGNSFTGGPICGEIQKVDWNGNVVWDFVYSTTNYCTHHDICPMPNGNVLAIAYERKTSSEVTAAGCTTAIEMWPDKIVEIQPTGATTGTVVWEWHAWDHLVQDVNSSAANYQTSVLDHPELLNINYQTQKDWLHMNGLDYNPITDQIAFTCHNTDEIYVIDHSTTTSEAAGHTGGNSGRGGDILYRWGNPDMYDASGTTILNVTHDAHWIPEGVPNAGYLVAFNNRGVSNSQSSVDQIDAPENGYVFDHTSGQAYQPTTYTLRHAASGYTSNMGNSQQLPNGNMLVCIALSGYIYEIDPAGNTIWSKTVSGSVPQAFRYDECYVNNTAPAIPTITQVGSDLSSSSATTYQWYLNGTAIPGATSQIYTPAQSGIYLVRITDANGCVYMYSAGFDYTAAGVGVGPEEESGDWTIYPNPTDGILHVQFTQSPGTEFTLRLYTLTGQLAAQYTNTQTLDVSSLSNGMYMLKLVVDGKEISVQRFILNR